MSLSDFFHSSDNVKPAHYLAFKDTIYRCGKCGRNIEKKSWPAYCNHCGAFNDRPE